MTLRNFPTGKVFNGHNLSVGRARWKNGGKFGFDVHKNISPLVDGLRDVAGCSGETVGVAPRPIANLCFFLKRARYLHLVRIVELRSITLHQFKEFRFGKNVSVLRFSCFPYKGGEATPLVLVGPERINVLSTEGTEAAVRSVTGIPLVVGAVRGADVGQCHIQGAQILLYRIKYASRAGYSRKSHV